MAKVNEQAVVNALAGNVANFVHCSAASPANLPTRRRLKQPSTRPCS